MKDSKGMSLIGTYLYSEKDKFYLNNYAIARFEIQVL